MTWTKLTYHANLLGEIALMILEQQDSVEINSAMEAAMVQTNRISNNIARNHAESANLTCLFEFNISIEDYV